MAPVELECPAGGTCTYVTPKLEITITLLEMHERTAHSRDDGASATGRSCKPEKFPRPTVGMDETSERWGDFATAWEQYKEEYALSGNALTRQLYACCTPELATGSSRSTCGKYFTLDEKTLLLKMKELSVQYQNPAVYVQTFLSSVQNQDENVRHFLSRLKGVASYCNFQTKCECGKFVSYADSITQFKLVAGLVDEEIKEDVLSAGDKTLEETVKIVEAKESAKRAKSSLTQNSSQSSINKVSGENKNDIKNMKECKYCGRQNHKSSYEERKNSCPAFDKKCDKCGRVGHFKKKCL